MKKILFLTSIMVLFFMVNAFGQNNKRTIKKPTVKRSGICTGCCDPCYDNDWWKIRNQRRSRAKHKSKVKGIQAMDPMVKLRRRSKTKH